MAKLMKLRITDAAKTDLKDIRQYTRRDYGADQVRVYMGHLNQGFKTLLHHPEIGFAVGDLKKGYRCFRVQYHSIYYKFEDDTISVVAVLHESQLPKRHLEQRRQD